MVAKENYPIQFLLFAAKSNGTAKLIITNVEYYNEEISNDNEENYNSRHSLANQLLMSSFFIHFLDIFLGANVDF